MAPLTFSLEHQNDWDEHLPYISMAYRAAEHETTGITPNYMMLGREVTTPLDIQYCMPRSIGSLSSPGRFCGYFFLILSTCITCGLPFRPQLIL
jgi:hypothetical protein